MKKALSLMFALAILASCSQQPKDTEGTTDSTTSTPTMSRTDSVRTKLIGTWRDRTGLIYRFHEDHTLELYNEGRRLQEYWELDGDTLKISSDKNDKPSNAEILKLNDNELNLFIEFFGDIITFVRMSEVKQ